MRFVDLKGFTYQADTPHHRQYFQSINIDAVETYQFVGGLALVLGQLTSGWMVSIEVSQSTWLELMK